MSYKGKERIDIWQGLKRGALLTLIIFLLTPAVNSKAQVPVPPTPHMPSESHQSLATHAALSHGMSNQIADWIGQGAYDEDHCINVPYPPCTGLLAEFGFHSWDPDTNGYWLPPLIASGPGLDYMISQFSKAVQAYQGGDVETAYLWFGRALHILGDQATPAHAHLDMHVFGDTYEEWLDVNDFANTDAWQNNYPPDPSWDMDFREIPAWSDLDPDLQNQLNSASGVYGGRSSGEELWLLGPEGSDVVLFRLLYLMAEEADNWDSNDFAGEKENGDLSDEVYLTQMRDKLFPLLIPLSAAMIDYFEYVAVEKRVYLPIVVNSP